MKIICWDNPGTTTAFLFYDNAIIYQVNPDGLMVYRLKSASNGVFLSLCRVNVGYM